MRKRLMPFLLRGVSMQALVNGMEWSDPVRAQMRRIFVGRA